MAATKKQAATIYQLKVTLRGSKPPIWRRLLVSSEITLGQLHDVIQAAMGWEDAHLHIFNIDGEQYSTPMPFDDSFLKEMGAKNDLRVKLGKLISTEGANFTYEYDFGDSWEHQILVEKILPPDPNQKTPVCIKGKRACPPEDVGGIWGYEAFLEAIKDPENPEAEELKEWYGGEFDPEAFDLDEINEYLKDLKG
jgi:hypothetical protein